MTYIRRSSLSYKSIDRIPAVRYSAYSFFFLPCVFSNNFLINQIKKMNIYVSNLGFQLGDEDLRALFAAYGEVSSSKVIMDRETNRSRGFGFVEMPNDAEGQEAIKKLNGAMVAGKSLSVNIARPKEKSDFKKRKNFW